MSMWKRLWHATFVRRSTYAWLEENMQFLQEEYHTLRIKYLQLEKEQKMTQQPAAPEASVWATSTDLAGTPHERKVYFVLIKDGERTLNIALTTRLAEYAVQADTYVVPDYDYTIHDGCDHDRDECVLDNPNFEEDEYGPQPDEVYQEVRKEYLKAAPASNERQGE